MKIDLRQTRTLVISCEDQQERRRNIESQLTAAGMRCDFVEGIRCQPGIIGCALSHLKILTRFAHALPLIVLEDDCSVAASFAPVLDVPPGVDLVYLGVSIWGHFPEVHPHGFPMGAIATRHNESWLRLHNMLSTHALLYLTPATVRAAHEAIVRCLVYGEPFDFGFARIQQQVVAVTPNQPCFFQDGRFRGSEDATRQRLIPVEDPTSVRASCVGKTLHVARPMPACLPI